MQHQLPHIALAVFFALATAAVTAPGLVLIGDGLIGGLPIPLAWNIVWILLSFAALALYHRTTDGGRGDDDD